MAIEMQKKMSTFDDQNIMENGYDKQIFDEDGHQKRTGTLLTATAHVITAVIGAGVLSLAWAIAQLGWIAGPIILLTISFITLYCSTLLTDCYRTPDPITGKRNLTYMEAVKVNLGCQPQNISFLDELDGSNFIGTVRIRVLQKNANPGSIVDMVVIGQNTGERTHSSQLKHD